MHAPTYVHAHVHDCVCAFIIVVDVQCAYCMDYVCVLLALGGIKKYQFRYIANIIRRYYGIPSLKVIVGH